jgi:hypothetical protein
MPDLIITLLGCRPVEGAIHESQIHLRFGFGATIMLGREDARAVIATLARLVPLLPENAPQTPVAPLSATQDGNASAGSREVQP